MEECLLIYLLDLIRAVRDASASNNNVIFIDPRTGSGELRPLFSAFSIPIIDDEYLSSGDFAFEGKAIDKEGRPKSVMVGVERKSLGDLLQCLDDARFVGVQLPKMFEEYHFAFLFVEGIWRPDAEGYVEQACPARDDRVFYWRRVYTGKKIVLFSALANHLNTLRLKTNLIVVETADKLSTAWHVANLYKWFNDKAWDEHRSHLREYDPASTFRGKSSFERRIAACFDGIGHDRSALIEAAFPGVKDVTSPMEQMMAATEKDWAAIDGIGRATAEKVYRQLHGRNEIKESKQRKKKG